MLDIRIPENYETALAAAGAQRYRMLIDGTLCNGSSSREVIDPATRRLIARSPVADDEQVNAAIEAAARAFSRWRATSITQRARIAHAIADTIVEHLDELAQLVVLEQGKTLQFSQADARKAVEYARYFAGLHASTEFIREDESTRIELRRTPIGVVAAIVPWNFPLYQATYKMIPALMAGNTVVLKPSEHTPLHAMRLAELIHNIVPPGVVNILGDDGSVGPRLVAHPRVGMVSFTGSTAVGKAIIRSGADTVKRVIAELSGNDPAIVLEDADVDAIARRLYDSAFINSGQRCVAIKRIFAHDAVYDSLVQQLAEIADSARLGHGLTPGTDVGPVQNSRQLADARRWLDRARISGTIAAGGRVWDEPGFFVAPTIIRDVQIDSPFLDQEIFLPIRAVVRFTEIDTVIRRLDEEPFGLGASVWGTDLARAADIASRIDSGQIWVNHHGLAGPDVPSSGHRQSGLGVKFGVRALQEFTNPQAFTIFERAGS